MGWFVLLLILFVAFVAYAVWTQYSKTDASGAVKTRIWSAMAAAFFALAAAVGAYLQNLGG